MTESKIFYSIPKKQFQEFGVVFKKTLHNTICQISGNGSVWFIVCSGSFRINFTIEEYMKKFNLHKGI